MKCIYFKQKISTLLGVGCLLMALPFFAFSCSSGEDAYSGKKSESPTVKNGSTYTFYYSHASTTPLYVLTGKDGDTVPFIPVPKRTFYKFSSWQTDEHTSLPSKFGTIDLSFYAQWDSSTQIGTKIRPSVVGDIVFTDGSATPFTEVITTPLTDEQKKNVAAIIFTTTYNQENGDNKSGKTMLGIGVVGKHTKWCEGTIKVNDTNVLLSIYTGYDIQSVFSSSQPAQNLSLSPYDGSKNLPKTDHFLAYACKYAPSFYFAYTYSTKTVEMREEYRDGWYLPTLFELRAIMNDQGLRSTIKNIFTLVGKNFDANSNTTGKAQSTLLLTSYCDSSDPEEIEPGDYGGQYSEKGMWVSLRMFDITAQEQKMRDKTPHVNPKDSYKKAAAYHKVFAYDFEGKENLVKKNTKGFDKDKDPDDDDDAVYQCYAYPIREFK